MEEQFTKEALARIKAWRLIRGLSLSDVAFHLNISPSAYRKIEIGKCPLSLDRLIRISLFLEFDISSLLKNLDTPYEFIQGTHPKPSNF
ncbi:helix-turn-helix domain-containing protein [Croceimicrobium hydrocarbonivorans]|uniref:Helix-turn-helix transcriptional regulator n=1 Tax=Croceimicrobium hydrocarbonivorans TaxID=2761580 RepID=A0A7H0VAG9_9FLAO|nr:helix-turn-helix transcriptional regulator [Croceimicrobium hydrocarbonivorans]QNR22717.1 helix-turn-helix transcriptional regulator [Croceimicrobium hydrocarbonivorans]